MTAKIWTGETTVAGGTVMTASNSGGSAGTALDSVTVVSPGSATFGSTAPVIANTRSVRLQQPTAGGTGRARAWYEFSPSPTRLQTRFAFRQRLDPNTGNVIAAITDTTYGTPYPFQLSITPRSGARHTVVSALGTEVLDLGALSFGSAQSNFYWADCYLQKGNTTTTPKGAFGFRLFDYDGDQLAEYISPTSGINVGTLNVPRMVWGGNAGIQQDLDVAWMKVTDEAAAFQGLPPMAPVPPGIVAPARPIPFEPGTVKVLNFSASDPDGTIASIHAVVTSGPTSPTVTPVDVTGLGSSSVTFALQFSALAASQYEIEVWVVDNSGTESARVTIVVDTYGTGALSILEDLSSGGVWTRTGGASDLDAATDNDDTTYFTSGYNPDHAKKRFRISAVRPGRTFTITPKTKREPADGVAITPVARLYKNDGVTLAQTRTVDSGNSPLAVGTTPATSTILFDPATATPPLTAEADLVDLQVELDYDQ